MAVKPTWIPTWHAMNNVSWILRQAHLKEVVLRENWETMTLKNLTTLDLT